MKKVLLLVVLFVAFSAISLHADVFWNVNSDYNSCRTYVYVGLHDETVVITKTRVNADLEPIENELDHVTLSRTSHYYISTPCPYRRYLYRIYTEVNGVRTLCSNQIYYVRAADNLAPYVACAHQCYETEVPKD